MNPILVGDLTNPPNKINIQIGNVNLLLLEENNIFVIAESYSERFICNDWIAKYIPNEIYNKAECSESGKRLLAKHSISQPDKFPDKNKLSPGIIAAIVIVCIFVVATVVILVVFLISRKKNSNNSSYNENETVSSGGDNINEI